jgi:hypothetical protein
MQQLPNDLLRFFAYRLNTKAFYSLSTISKRYSMTMLNSKVPKQMKVLFTTIRKTPCHFHLRLTSYTPDQQRNGLEWIRVSSSTHHSGYICQLISYLNDSRHGLLQKYDSNGDPQVVHEYRNGFNSGYSIDYVMHSLRYYRDGELLINISYREIGLQKAVAGVRFILELP